MSFERSILIIDDDVTLRESIADLFRLSGYQVLEAESGEQGLEMLQRKRPDFIISDLMMLGMDGVALRKHLLNSSEGSIPFIFISAKADVHSILKQNELENELVIAKPFDSAKLIEMVENILVRNPGSG